MAPMAQYDMNLRDYWRILRRRKWIVILVPILFALSSYVLALQQTAKPLYRATAAVRVERAVNLTGLLQEVITYNPVGALETQAALVKGLPVMGRAAKKLGLIPAATTAEEITANLAYLKTVERLQEQVEVKRLEGTSLIEISATAASPEEAAWLANSLAEAFQEDNLETRYRQVREARRFIESQLGEVDARLQQSEKALSTFQDANQLYALPEGSKGVVNRLAALQVDLAGIKRAIDEVDGMLRLLESRKALDRPIILPSESTDPVLAKLNTTLLDLTLEREKLLLMLFPAHPQVKQVEEQIAGVRKSLQGALMSRRETLQVQGDEMQRSIDRLRQEQAGIPEITLELARREREVKVNERIFTLLKEKHQEVLIREKEQVGEINVVRPATAVARPINPTGPVTKSAVGLVIGLTLGLVLAFLAEAFDPSIGGIEEVEALLESTVMGVIPHLDLKMELAEDSGEAGDLDVETAEKFAFLISLFLPWSRAVEAFRALRTNLVVACQERGVKTLVVTSSTPGEGKTTVAINLAIAFAQLGKRTLLVEGDLRQPYLHHAFGVSKEPGFTDVVNGSTPLEEATLGFTDLILGKAGIEAMIDRPGMDNLFLLPSGHQPSNPAEFLSSSEVANFVGEVRQRYDYVIFDAAPSLPVTDPAILGAHVDGSLLVARAARVPRVALRRANALLEGAKVRVLGVCLTAVMAEMSLDYEVMGRYRYQPGGRPWRVVPRWGDLLTVFLQTRRKTLAYAALLFIVLVGLAAGLWGWRTGHIQFPFLATAQVPPVSAEARVSADPGLQPAARTPSIADHDAPHQTETPEDRPQTQVLMPVSAPTTPVELTERNASRATDQVYPSQPPAPRSEVGMRSDGGGSASAAATPEPRPRRAAGGSASRKR